MRRYRVMRHYVLQGVFTFAELRTWMLAHLPSEYHADIRAARRAYTKHWSHDYPSLRWIACNSEYCSITVDSPEKAKQYEDEQRMTKVVCSKCGRKDDTISPCALCYLSGRGIG